MEKKIKYTDIELLSFMEGKGMDLSEENINYIKEHIEEISISITEDTAQSPKPTTQEQPKPQDQAPKPAATQPQQKPIVDTGDVKGNVKTDVNTTNNTVNNSGNTGNIATGGSSINTGSINNGQSNTGNIGGNSVFGNVTGGINGNVNNSVTGGKGSITQGHNSTNSGSTIGRDQKINTVQGDQNISKKGNVTVDSNNTNSDSNNTTKTNSDNTTNTTTTTDNSVNAKKFVKGDDYSGDNIDNSNINAKSETKAKQGNNNSTTTKQKQFFRKNPQDGKVWIYDENNKPIRVAPNSRQSEYRKQRAKTTNKTKQENNVTGGDVVITNNKDMSRGPGKGNSKKTKKTTGTPKPTTPAVTPKTPARRGRPPKGTTVVKESYYDNYQFTHLSEDFIYDILFENDLEITNESMISLYEGLLDGTIYLEREETQLSFKHSKDLLEGEYSYSFEDIKSLLNESTLSMLLSNNDFEVTSGNINALYEALESGDLVVFEKDVIIEEYFDLLEEEDIEEPENVEEVEKEIEADSIEVKEDDVVEMEEMEAKDTKEESKDDDKETPEIKDDLPDCKRSLSPKCKIINTSKRINENSNLLYFTESSEDLTEEFLTNVLVYNKIAISNKTIKSLYEGLTSGKVCLEAERVITNEIKTSSVIKNNGKRFLEAFLVEECGMSKEEFETLTEETQVESVKDIAMSLLKIIEEKLATIDTTCADRSRGDIKNLRELAPIQDVITQLEALVERDENAIPEYSKAIGTIIKAILYINQYSATFKEAYRNKKSLMILKYQSLILSVITSVSYLISTIVDYKVDHLTLKRNVEGIMEFAPLKSLEEFIKSVDSGEFKLVTNDTAVLREYYLEIPVETMSAVLESTDYMPMIVNGIEEIFKNITGNNKLTNLLYKAVGVVLLVFSLRDVLYTIFRMKTRVSEMISGIEGFANLNNGANVLGKLSQFTNKFRVDAENGSDMSKREIEDENKVFFNNVRSIQRDTKINPIQPNNPAPEAKVVGMPDNSVQDVFGFDF